ncbi:GNAT family N-acetyltransferase [Jiulongibacter sediminis]|nr:GNAT family N-acetyltransferase [Jiulongibacter sediminis]
MKDFKPNNLLEMLSIVPLNSVNQHHLKRLNVAWLEKYFYVEPADLIQLSEPQKEILDKGGFTFFATYKGQTIGTVSLLKTEEKIYELSKMAVDEEFQGFGVGRQLMYHALTHAQILRAEKIILYTNTRLKSAISLYEKFGFSSVPLGESSYARSNYKMELQLKKTGMTH